MASLISAVSLHKSFGATQAVVDLSLEVSEGEIYGLVGPDGAGKTTTMRMLCGAMQPNRSGREYLGLIHIAGFDMLRQTELARAQIGYLPQRFSLYEDLTVMENIRFFAEVRGISASEWRPRCNEILHFVGLDPFVDRKAGELSGGMKQKLSLAVALVHRPLVLLLDEPTTGVDPVTRQDFWQLIIRLAAPRKDGQRSVAVIVSTPYMDEAARCRRVGFMQNGRMLVEGTPAALRARLDGSILELRGRPLEVLRRASHNDPDVLDAQMFGDRIHLHVRENCAQAVMDRLNQHVPEMQGEVTQLRLVPPQLEDVFIALLENNDVH